MGRKGSNIYEVPLSGQALYKDCHSPNDSPEGYHDKVTRCQQGAA